MKRLAILWSCVILCLCSVIALAQSPVQTAPTIENVRIGVDGRGQTRIVLDLDDRPDFVLRPAGDQQPELFIDLLGGDWALAEDEFPDAHGLISTVRKRGPGKAAVALTKPALPVESFVIPPSDANPYYRLVIDLASVPEPVFSDAVAEAAPVVTPTAMAEAEPEDDRGAPRRGNRRTAEAVTEDTPEADPVGRALNAANERQAERTAPVEDSAAESGVAANRGNLTLPPEILARAAASPGIPAPRLKPRDEMRRARLSGPTLIVLDPGHGGRDPGAIGSTGVYEKTLTLSAAKTLRGILESRGYRVLLTREDDTYVDLEDRLEFARTKQADLFLSIHADANLDKTARGGTVYTIDRQHSDRMTKEARQAGNFTVFNVDASQASDDVSAILFSLAASNTQNESSKLAQDILGSLDGRIQLVNNSHRQMGFRVLLSPDVPAVLVEMAFLSNVEDEKNLKSADWRRRAMIGVANGIDSYMEDARTLRRAGVGMADPAP